MNINKILKIMNDWDISAAIIQKKGGWADVISKNGQYIYENINIDAALEEVVSTFGIYLYCHDNVCTKFRKYDIERVFEL